MLRNAYEIGVDPGVPGEDKTVFITFEKDFTEIRRRMMDRLKVPNELLTPKEFKLCRHPAFSNDDVIRMMFATFHPEKEPE